MHYKALYTWLITRITYCVADVCESARHTAARSMAILNLPWQSSVHTPPNFAKTPYKRQEERAWGSYIDFY